MRSALLLSVLLLCQATTVRAQNPQNASAPPPPRKYQLNLNFENPFKKAAKEQRPESAPAVHPTHWGVAEPNPAVEALPPGQRDFQRMAPHKASYVLEPKAPPPAEPKMLDPFRNWWKGSSRTQSLFATSAGTRLPERPVPQQPIPAYAERFLDEPPAAQTATTQDPRIQLGPASVSYYKPIITQGDKNSPAKIKYVEVRQ